MADDMEKDAIEIATFAMNEFMRETEMANHIKKEFDKKYRSVQMAASDAAGLAGHAHTLKGQLAYLHARRAEEAAARLEHVAGQVRVWSRDEHKCVDAAVAGLCAELERVEENRRVALAADLPLFLASS